jgi:hypothetical protein
MVWKYCINITFFSFFLLSHIFAQQSLDLDCGRFQLEVDDNGGFQYLYPADFNEEDHVRADGDISFMASNWTDQNGALYANAWETDLYSYTSRKYLKYPLPVIIVDGTDVSKTLSSTDSVDNNLIADQVIRQIYISSIGLRIESNTYGFSHQDFQDFAITHLKIINTGEADEFEGVDIEGQNLENLHLIMDRWRIWPGDHLPDKHHPGNASFYADYYGDEEQDSLQILYGWDGDDPDNGPYEDEGNPAFASDWEFQTPYYGGFGPIHADQSSINRTHDPSKVVSVLRGATYDLSNWIDEQYFTYLVTPGNFPSPIDPDLPGMDPRNEQQPRLYMSIGPYNMAFGDTINIVLFMGVGARSNQECREWGERYKNGEISDEQKNTFLRWGKKDLFNKLSRAKKLWQDDLQLPGGWNPLPPASITIESGPGLVDLEWEAVQTATTYNIYRAVGIQDSVIYPLLTEGVTSNTYQDADVDRGFDYYYYITAVNDNGKESSQYWTRTSRKSAVPRTGLGKDDMSDIRVVPNPFIYDKSGKSNYPGQKDKLLFAGLPGPCKITIFTPSGDIVDEIDHDSNEGTHEWFQITKYNQFIASGIYVYHIESTEGRGSMIGKFIIIR